MGAWFGTQHGHQTLNDVPLAETNRCKIIQRDLAKANTILKRALEAACDRARWQEIVLRMDRKSAITAFE